MKTINYIVIVLQSIFFLSACSNEQTIGDNEGKVPLEISVVGGSERAVIGGNTLPSRSYFGIYGVSDKMEDGITADIQNLSVYYEGTCRLAKKVLLDDETISLKAYYPYSTNSKDGIVSINILDQVDFLYGKSVDSKGNLGYVNRRFPKATIAFKHALSCLTFKMKHTSEYGEDFVLNCISFAQLHASAQFDVFAQKLILGELDELSFPVDVLVTKEYVSFSLLVMPTEGSEFFPESMTLRKSTFEEYQVELPKGVWKAGQEYTYEIVFGDAETDVSNTNIRLWKPVTELEMEVTVNDIAN